MKQNQRSVGRTSNTYLLIKFLQILCALYIDPFLPNCTSRIESWVRMRASYAQLRVRWSCPTGYRWNGEFSESKSNLSASRSQRPAPFRALQQRLHDSNGYDIHLANLNWIFFAKLSLSSSWVQRNYHVASWKCDRHSGGCWSGKDGEKIEQQRSLAFWDWPSWGDSVSAGISQPGSQSVKRLILGSSAGSGNEIRSSRTLWQTLNDKKNAKTKVDALRASRSSLKFWENALTTSIAF